MAHWSDRYLGEPYRPVEADCAALAVRVAREQFGQHIDLPQHAAGLRSGSRQIDAIAEAGSVAERVTTPRDGDVVLMRCRGVLAHVGVYCRIGGDGWVLHALRTAGAVVRHRLRDLPGQGLAVEGFYRWLP